MAVSAVVRSTARVILAMLGIIEARLEELYAESKKDARILQAITGVRASRRALTDVIENHSHI